jgi:3-oxoadipate enol-lactonase
MPRLNVNATTVHYQWDGPPIGPVVMLAHPLGANLNLWQPQVSILIAAGYRVLRYDIRGHGQTAAPEHPYSIEMLAGDAIGLMDAVGLEKVHFCGISLGGMVGQQLGATHGERLDSLILSSTAAHMPPPDMWEERIRTVRSEGMAAVADATLDRWFTQTGRQNMPAEVQSVRTMITATPIAGFAGCCAAIRDLDLREAIRSITVPTQIIVGRHDQGTPVAAAEFIHERIRASRLDVVADAAHLVNVERASVFNKTVVSFLENQRR